MQSIVHCYHYDVSTAAGLAAWSELQSKLKAAGLRVFETWSGDSHYKPAIDGAAVTLATAHIFNNQWNATVSGKGVRLFDWALDARPIGAPKHIRRGHWIEQTAEMREIRRNTTECGYCGKQRPAAAGDVFCPAGCIESEYLKESDLYLLRMRPVDAPRDRAPLTPAELANLLPQYRKAQIYGATARGAARIAGKRESIDAKRDKAIANATAEHAGFTFLMDRGIDPGLAIFYPHTARFCFGWRAPLSRAVAADLREALGAEFPAEYDIKEESGN